MFDTHQVVTALRNDFEEAHGSKEICEDVFLADTWCFHPWATGEFESIDEMFVYKG